MNKKMVREIITVFQMLAGAIILSIAVLAVISGMTWANEIQNEFAKYYTVPLSNSGALFLQCIGLLITTATATGLLMILIPILNYLLPKLKNTMGLIEFLKRRKIKKVKDYFLGEEVGFHYTDPKDGMIVYVRTKIIDYVSVPRVALNLTQDARSKEQ